MYLHLSLSTSLSLLLPLFQGIACNLESLAFKRLHEATEEVLGESKPFSLCGSLPLVGDLQKAGFDVQASGMTNNNV